MTQQDVLDILGMHPAEWLTTLELAKLMRVGQSCAWRCCKRLHEAGFIMRKVIGSKAINGIPIFGYQLAEEVR
jgi:predicted transcriptional regulator